MIVKNVLELVGMVAQRYKYTKTHRLSKGRCYGMGIIYFNKPAIKR